MFALTDGLQTELPAASSPTACRLQCHSEGEAALISHEGLEAGLQGGEDGTNQLASHQRCQRNIYCYVKVIQLKRGVVLDIVAVQNSLDKPGCHVF